MILVLGCWRFFQFQIDLVIIQISYRMSIKIVTFGENGQVTKFLEKSRGGHSLQSEEAVNVQNITIAETNYLIFAVREKGLVSQQATGTNGLLFFLGGQTPLFEEKQYLTDLLSSKVQFDGVPVAVIFDRGHNLNLKDVVNYMELYRLKDRASMIKEINWDEKQWINDVYGWVKTQTEQNKGRGFQAAPKVVKLKAKYRQTVEEESQKKYQDLVNDKEVRGLGVKQQQETYIQREKQKLKQQNMANQLSNFSRNKKKMSPYDIKPTPNPKIQPNLHFFLKDPHSQPPPQVSIKIQTDQFKDRPAPPPFKPKKTGINTATQIQQNQLFSFDKQVKPILAILTTKALQSAALQIEQQEELLKMAKYKSAYEDRVKKQKEHEQKNIDQEQRIIKQKQKLLQQHRNRTQNIKNIQQRVQCYELANKFLSNIYYESTSKLITANAYPDSLNNFLKTDYLDEIIGKAATSYQKIVYGESAIKGIFEKDVVVTLQNAAHGVKEAREKLKKKLQARNINKSATNRKIHILYKHEHVLFSNFSKYLSKHFDNTIQEYIKVREQQIQEALDRNQSGELSEQEYLKVKLKDNNDFFAAGHQNFLVKNNQEICFTSTSNRYEKIKENYINNCLLLLDKDGEIIQEIGFQKGNINSPYVRHETGLRDIRENVNMDEGLVINLAKIPQKVKSIVLLSKFDDVQRFRAEAEAKKIKYSTYGLEFWQHKDPIHSKSIGQAIKWQQLVKVQQGEEPPAQNLLLVSYFLRRRPVTDFWTLEDVAYVPQPYKNKDQLQHFFEQLSKFYFRSNEFLKEEQQQQRIEQPPSSSQQRKGTPATKLKSKKVIQQPKKKIVLKVSTKILNQVGIQMNEPTESAIKKLKGSVQQWKQFLQTCDNGWQLFIKGKKLETIQQLSAYRKIGDIILKKITKIQEPKVEKSQEVQGQKQEQ